MRANPSSAKALAAGHLCLTISRWMRASVIALLIAGASPLHAGSSTVVVLATAKAAESPVSISLPATYLAAEIRIASDDEDWSLKLAGLDEARKLLVSLAEKEKFKVKIDQSLIFQQRYSKFSFSSSGGGSHDAFSDILLLAPIGDQTNLVQIVKQFRAIVGGIKPASRKVTVTLGSLFLALDDPESYRSELLKQIRTHVEASGRALGDKVSFNITGLDESIKVRQSGERNVEVYLPFRVSYSSRGGIE